MNYNVTAIFVNLPKDSANPVFALALVAITICFILLLIKELRQRSRQKPIPDLPVPSRIEVAPPSAASTSENMNEEEIAAVIAAAIIAFDADRHPANNRFSFRNAAHSAWAQAARHENTTK